MDKVCSSGSREGVHGYLRAGPGSEPLASILGPPSGGSFSKHLLSTYCERDSQEIALDWALAGPTVEVGSVQMLKPSRRKAGLELCCPEDRWGWVAGGSRLTTEFEQSLRVGRNP